MERTQRAKAISTATAELARNALVPVALREGFAALAEEVVELGRRVADLELNQLRKDGDGH